MAFSSASLVHCLPQLVLSPPPPPPCHVPPLVGIILGVANTLEMSFLGMAYATRLAKCTASSATLRFFATYLPPLIMFAAAGFGGWLVESGEFAGKPAVFIGFVAFAVVLLLSLVRDLLQL